MERREPPPTEEGWYVLHDFRTVDWAAWRSAPADRQDRAIREGIEYFRAVVDVADADEGAGTVASIVGHDADLLIMTLRPTLEEIEALERRFERTALADFTTRTDSYVSVTEASGYSGARDYFDPDAEADPGISRYIESRLRPTIPDADYVCFYPMDKRRDPEYNWYDLPFDERAEHMTAHGEIGKAYAGKVTQIVSGSVGFDDHEWGVTLFSTDPVHIKDLIYEMRFDPSTSRYAEFGRFRFGRRFEPEALETYLTGGSLAEDAAGHENASGHEHGSAAGTESSETSADTGDGPASAGSDDGDAIRSELQDRGVYAGQPHGEDVHAVVLYSTADTDELFEEVDGLRKNFDHYDSHVSTAVYRPTEIARDDAESAVASLWKTERAADTAAGFLAELPEVIRQAGDDADDSWGTMGMFYTVKPEHREDFVETFATVGGLLDDMDGHRQTDLLANREDENDMFIASRWDAREDAMAFFRSDAFADTVEWGRDVLADRPRHVFLA